tara:strand:+ start:4625 stop:5356 length:732 start_codon:yes stop_codon:yes gene_type:complete
MSKLLLVMQDGQETEWNIQLHDTLRTFAINELKIPSAVFFSDKGILLPQDGNIKCLVPHGCRIFMGFLPTSNPKYSCKSYCVRINDVPFLHAAENESVLAWISRCCAEPDKDDPGMMVTLSDNDVQVKFGGGQVIVTMENGATKQLRVMDWISSLPCTIVEAKCSMCGVDRNHIYALSPHLYVRIPRPTMYVIDDYNEVEKVEKCPPSESSPPRTKRHKQNGNISVNGGDIPTAKADRLQACV